MRDGLIPLGVTLMSAGSHTEPGGYTGAGHDHTRATKNGPATTPDAALDRSANSICHLTDATGQFEIADERSPAEVARRIRQLGYEPVWKDWDMALGAEAPADQQAQTLYS